MFYDRCVTTAPLAIFLFLYHHQPHPLMAEILSFLSYEECLALVDMQSLLVHVVDITQLLAPKGWSKFTYYLGRYVKQVVVVGGARTVVVYIEDNRYLHHCLMMVCVTGLLSFQGPGRMLPYYPQSSSPSSPPPSPASTTFFL